MVKKPKLRELKEAILAVVKGPYTTKFPSEPHEPPDGFRGKPEFQEDDCVGCAACAEVCPALAIRYTDDELNCTTKTGVKLTKIWDLATFDRTECVERIEHPLVLCEVCGAIVGTRKHLRWVAEQLGAKAYANPTLILAADGSMKLARPDAGRTAEPALARSDMMRVMCPACRRTTVVRELWGE